MTKLETSATRFELWVLGDANDFKKLADCSLSDDAMGRADRVLFLPLRRCPYIPQVVGHPD